MVIVERENIESSKLVENIVGKGEIAHNEQFLHLLQYFQTYTSKCRYLKMCGKGLIYNFMLPYCHLWHLTFHTIPIRLTNSYGLR